MLGYGKCGMALAARLKALNAITYVAARNPVQLSMAYEQGRKGKQQRLQRRAGAGKG